MPRQQPITEPDEFARVLKAALSRRGLPLSRVVAHLARRGIPLSAAALSLWQRGQRRPERTASLRAVEELESILELDSGTLTDVLRPAPPRGASLLPAADPSALRRLLGTRSSAEQALGTSIERLNEHLRPVSIRDVVHLDRDGRVHRVTVFHALRALRDGADRLTGIFQLDAGQIPLRDITVHSGRLGATRLDRARNCLVVEFAFGRSLARGETSIIEYELLIGGRDAAPVTCHERVIRNRLRDLVIQVRFHPETTPAHCAVHSRRDLGATPRKVRRIPVDASPQAHVILRDPPPGIHSLSWTWPPGAPPS
ncbi:XRE family transcriptional regulator [Streptomyces sp. NPDC046887]|uniref:XRE family transcriptional regulator n=1 Tax=Streptomyces sp. NPDC046887 TaxID=3155472 RepID=UPI0033E18ADF